MQWWWQWRRPWLAVVSAVVAGGAGVVGVRVAAAPTPAPLTTASLGRRHCHHHCTPQVHNPNTYIHVYMIYLNFLVVHFYPLFFFSFLEVYRTREVAHLFSR